MVGVPGAVWTGRITRIASGLDPVTRTVRAVVRVKDPYRAARPPERPPLQRGVYTRVRLSVMSPEALLVVPVGAVHTGSVYLADQNDRLERRPVEVAFEQGDLAVVIAGLKAGERVVVDDLPWALPGMAVAPLRDEELERWMAARANRGKP
jgi:multidrug efflux pump subunit AcrA (membrane-fusion protein)